MPAVYRKILFLVLFTVVLPPAAAAGTAPSDEKKEAAAKIRELVARIAVRSYPEIKLKKIRVKTFASDSNFFKARFSYTRFFTLQKMRHIVYVNPRVFELNAPAEGIRGILAHELAHVAYYTEKNRCQLIGLVRLAANGFTADFERRADLEAIRRGYGEDLIKYRRWLYQNIPASELAGKKRDYFTPAEIRLIIKAAAKNPAVIENLRRRPPRGLAQLKRTLQ